MNGEIYIDMTVQEYPTSGSSYFLLKRWNKYNIYSKTGSYNKSENPSENIYQSASIYLYDYVVVPSDYYNELVYTSSYIDSTPSFDSDWVPSENGWLHKKGTFKNTPNLITNNYKLTYDPTLSTAFGRPVYGTPYVYTYNQTYYEIVNGYPRNHLTHKRLIFALYTTKVIKNDIINDNQLYIKNRQTNLSTIGLDGLEDGSEPIQSFEVGNVSLYKNDNIINQ